MKLKEKILDALELTLEDISEERLIDILIDSYKAKDQRIRALQGENARERENLFQSNERIRNEIIQMRSDPLYAAKGEYFFMNPGAKIKMRVEIQGPCIQIFERSSDIEIMYARTSLQDYWK